MTNASSYIISRSEKVKQYISLTSLNIPLVRVAIDKIMPKNPADKPRRMPQEKWKDQCLRTRPAESFADCNVAVQLGHELFNDGSGRYLYCVDVDLKNPLGIATYETIELDLLLEYGPFSRTESGGLHFYFWHGERLNTHTGLMPGVDFQGFGGLAFEAGSQFFVAGRPCPAYQWTRPPELVDLGDGEMIDNVPRLPAWLLDKVKQKERRARELSPDHVREINAQLAHVTKQELTSIKHLLGMVEPTQFADYHAWLGVGMSLHHGFGGSAEGLETWDAWSQSTAERGGGEYDEAKVEAAWNSFSVGKTGIKGKPRTFASIKKLLADDPTTAAWLAAHAAALRDALPEPSETQRVLVTQEKDEKKPNAYYYPLARAWISHDKAADEFFYGPFPYTFHLRRTPSFSNELFLESEGQVVKLIEQSFVEKAYAEEIDKRIEWERANVPQCDWRLAPLAFAPNPLKTMAAGWFNSQEPTFDERRPILPLLQKSEPGYTFHRLDFDAVDGLTPVFDFICGKIINGRGRILQAFIGSLFQWQYTLQQYVWMYGDGMNGKGTLETLLKKLLGDAFGTYDADPHHSSRFLASTLQGKRLAVISDCMHPEVVQSATFKAITGGGPVHVERKGRDGYNEVLPVQFLISANEKPAISMIRADLRRAIFCEFEPTLHSELIVDFEWKLWQERGGILAKCIKAFKENFNNKTGSITDVFQGGEESQEILVAREHESWCDILFDTYFIVEKHSEMGAKAFIDVCKEEKLSPKQIGKFKKWLSRDKNIKQIYQNKGGRREWVWINVKKKINQTTAILTIVPPPG